MWDSVGSTKPAAGVQTDPPLLALVAVIPRSRSPFWRGNADGRRNWYVPGWAGWDYGGMPVGVANLAWAPLYQAMVAGGVDYRPWDGQGLGDNLECFVCSVKLDDDTRTLEDVIPKRMQRQLPACHQGFGIVLPNLTTLPPGRVLVPACLLCNGTHLGRIEEAVASAFRGGPEPVSALPERTLRIWFAKIAYGLRRNDMRLRNDIRDPNAPTIATTADLAELEELHLLLQEARGVVHVTDGHSTFFAFRSQSVGCNVCDFDFAVPTGWPYPGMVRLGEVTLMAWSATIVALSTPCAPHQPSSRANILVVAPCTGSGPVGAACPLLPDVAGRSVSRSDSVSLIAASG